MACRSWRRPATSCAPAAPLGRASERKVEVNELMINERLLNLINRQRSVVSLGRKRAGFLSRPWPAQALGSRHFCGRARRGQTRRPWCWSERRPSGGRAPKWSAAAARRRTGADSSAGRDDEKCSHFQRPRRSHSTSFQLANRRFGRQLVKDDDATADCPPAKQTVQARPGQAVHLIEWTSQISARAPRQ